MAEPGARASGSGVFVLALVSVMLRHQFTLLPWWSALEQTTGMAERSIVDLGLVVLFLGFVLGAFLVASVLSAAVGGRTPGLEHGALRPGLRAPGARRPHRPRDARSGCSEGLHVIAGYFVALARSVFQGIPIGSQPAAPVFAVAPSVVTLLKFEIVALGILGSAIALVKIARRTGTREAIGQALPHLLLLLVLSGMYLYVFLAS